MFCDLYLVRNRGEKPIASREIIFLHPLLSSLPLLSFLSFPFPSTPSSSLLFFLFPTLSAILVAMVSLFISPLHLSFLSFTSSTCNSHATGLIVPSSFLFSFLLFSHFFSPSPHLLPLATTTIPTFYASILVLASISPFVRTLRWVSGAMRVAPHFTQSGSCWTEREFNWKFNLLYFVLTIQKFNLLYFVLTIGNGWSHLSDSKISKLNIL